MQTTKELERAVRIASKNSGTDWREKARLTQAAITALLAQRRHQKRARRIEQLDEAIETMSDHVASLRKRRSAELEKVGVSAGLDICDETVFRAAGGQMPEIREWFSPHRVLSRFVAAKTEEQALAVLREYGIEWTPCGGAKA